MNPKRKLMVEKRGVCDEITCFQDRADVFPGEGVLMRERWYTRKVKQNQNKTEIQNRKKIKRQQEGLFIYGEGPEE